MQVGNLIPGGQAQNRRPDQHALANLGYVRGAGSMSNEVVALGLRSFRYGDSAAGRVSPVQAIMHAGAEAAGCRDMR